MNIKNKRGFNLYELMVAVAVLSIGLVAIYESFLLVADASAGLPYYLKTQFLINEMVWEQKYLLWENGYIFPGTENGSLYLDTRPVKWVRETKLIDSTQGLYSVDVLFSWKSGNRNLNNRRVTYVRR